MALAAAAALAGGMFTPLPGQPSGGLASDRAIRLFEDRVKRSPADAVSFTILGQLYARHAWERGDVEAYDRAEAALRQALELLPSYSPAGAHLASVFYSQHRFSEAAEVARKTFEQDPREVQALATLGDAQLALGRYDEAEKSLAELSKRNSGAPVLSRLAYLDFLKGDTESALRRMQQAVEKAREANEPAAGISWYEAQLGDLYRGAGRLEEAAHWYDTARATASGAGLAHVETQLAGVFAAQGRFDEALTLYERAASVSPQPSVLGALGDLCTKLGKLAEAKDRYETVELLAKRSAAHRVVYKRELAVFYSDHDMHLSEALALAQEEWAARKDIYGADALAWALHRNGRSREAAEASAEALKLGTRDAALYFHAGAIARANGDYDRARELLEKALEINPHFSLLKADEARRILAGLDEESAGSGYGMIFGGLVLAAVFLVGVRWKLAVRKRGR